MDDLSDIPDWSAAEQAGGSMDDLSDIPDWSAAEQAGGSMDDFSDIPINRDSITEGSAVNKEETRQKE